MSNSRNKISSDHLSAFEKLIDAYGKIADVLPRFDRLNAALKNDHNFQAVVALMYADVLEFHRRAYKFIRRRGKYNTHGKYQLLELIFSR